MEEETKACIYCDSIEPCEICGNNMDYDDEDYMGFGEDDF